MSNINKKFFIKIPKNVSIYYCNRAQIVIIKNLLFTRTIRLKTKLLIDQKKRLVKLTREPFFKISNNEKKNLKALQGRQVNLLKQLCLDVYYSSCKKLNLVGVGFRVSNLTLWDLNLLHFKLGYSHFIYFKIPKNLKIFCLKANQIFILGNSYLFVAQIASLIKTYKIPEPYKGKGIRYATETISIKEGKKV